MTEFKLTFNYLSLPRAIKNKYANDRNQSNTMLDHD